MTKYKLIDYIYCAVCDHSEQYNDHTFICTTEDGPIPLKSIDCSALVFNYINLIGFLKILAELIIKGDADE